MRLNSSEDASTTFPQTQVRTVLVCSISSSWVPSSSFVLLQACLHVARVSRVLQQAGGHAMLVGVGGSGKQSLAKLAVYMTELTPMMIVISKSYSLNDFKTDLQVKSELDAI